MNLEVLLALNGMGCFAVSCLRKEKKGKDHAFWCQCNEKPSIIPGCPGVSFLASLELSTT